MKQRILIFSIFANFCLLGLVAYQYLSKSHFQKETQIKKRIALMLPVTHPSLENIKQGVIDSLQKNGTENYEFDVYTANGNRTLMLSQAEMAVAGEYDAIVPIATAPAQMVKELTLRKKINTPVVFIAAHQLKTLDPSIKHMTGILDYTSREKQIDMLQIFKPGIKSVLLVYNGSEPAFEEEKEELEAVLKKRDIKFKTVKVYQSNEIYNKTAPFVSKQNVDAVIIFKDNTVVAGIDALVKLCNKQGVVLMASDLDSVEKGAALGFGVSEYDLGVSGGYKVQAILEQDKIPFELPVAIMDDCKIKINLSTMNQQGLNIDDTTLLLMKLGETYE